MSACPTAAPLCTTAEAAAAAGGAARLTRPLGGHIDSHFDGAGDRAVWR